MEKKTNKKLIVTLSIISIVVILAALGLFFAGSTTRKLNKQLAIARELFDNAQYDDAIAEFAKALDIDPTCEEAYEKIARSHEIVGDDIASALEEINQDSSGFIDEYETIAGSVIERYTQAIEILTTGSSLIESTILTELSKEIEDKKDDVESKLETARALDEELKLKELEKDFLDKLASFDLIEDIDTWAEDLIIYGEVEVLSSTLAKKNYGPIESQLYDFIQLLYNNRDYDFAKKYFDMTNIDDAINNLIPWYEIGTATSDKYPNFWKACYYLINCYRAQNRLDDIKAIKNLAAEVMGNDFFLSSWSFVDSSGRVEYYNEYDLCTGKIGDDWSCEWTYDEHGNKIHYIDSDGNEKGMVYDDDNQIIRFNMLTDGIIEAYWLYDYEEDLFDTLDVYMHYYESNDIEDHTIMKWVDSYGNQLDVYFVD